MLSAGLRNFVNNIERFAEQNEELQKAYECFKKEQKDDFDDLSTRYNELYA